MGLAYYLLTVLVTGSCSRVGLSLGAKVDSKQTPSQGKASSDRFDPGSFFLPCFWKGGLGEGNDVAQLRIGVGLGGALLPPHGRRRARSLDDGILVKLRG